MEMSQTLSENETLEINEIQMGDTLPTSDILRTSLDGCFEVYQGPWGKYIRSCADPDANVVITDEHLSHFELNDNIHKIPAILWARWVKLCFHFVNKVKSEVEVSVRILRSELDPSQYRILVPKQKVSSATVRIDSFDEAIDIETGEKIESYPPPGWIPVGSSHSHNTMPSFFSSTDDKYELGDPGIHLVVGSIDVDKMKYTISASVVGGGRRFEMPYSNLIDATPVEKVSFHEDVLKYVDYSTPPLPIYPIVKVYNKVSSNKTSKSSKHDSHRYSKWLERYSGHSEVNYEYNNYMDDPFYYNDYGVGNNFTQDDSPKILKLWQIEDFIHDYIEQNSDDLNKIFQLYDLLSDKVQEVDELMGSNTP